MATLLFCVCATIALLFALVVVLHPDPIRSVLALVVTFFALAVIYVQLSAPLLASLQIIVYAGAVLVLFLFVIMLLGVRQVKEESQRSGLRLVASLVAALGLGGMIAARLWSFPTPAPDALAALPAAAQGSAAEAFGSVQSVARLLFDRHLFAFELVSVVLLTGLVGALVLTKRDPPVEEDRP